MFGQMVKDKNAIFIVPDELIWKEDSIVPEKKMRLTKEKLRERRMNYCGKPDPLRSRLPVADLATHDIRNL